MKESADAQAHCGVGSGFDPDRLRLASVRRTPIVPAAAGQGDDRRRDVLVGEWRDLRASVRSLDSVANRSERGPELPQHWVLRLYLNEAGGRSCWMGANERTGEPSGHRR